jgi:hypothetical protein
MPFDTNYKLVTGISLRNLTDSSSVTIGRMQSEDAFKKAVIAAHTELVAIIEISHQR